MHVRQYNPEDEQLVVSLSLEAWVPVFASERAVMGDAVFLALYPEWRVQQEREVRAVLSSPQNTSWVAAGDASIFGFASATLHRDAIPSGTVGEIVMLAVHPEEQGAGVGLPPTQTAVRWLQDNDASIALVRTGGDPGHAPARATYAKAGLVAMPTVSYYQAL